MSYKNIIEEMEVRQAFFVNRAGFDLDWYLNFSDFDESVLDAYGVPKDFKNQILPMKQMFLEERQRLRGIYGKPLSRYQREDDYYLICQLKEELVRLYNRIPMSTKMSGVDIGNILIGTTPMGRCNAQIFSSNRSNLFGIIMDDDIFRVSFIAMQIIASTLRYDDTGFFCDISFAERKINDNKHLADYFIQLIFSFVRFGCGRGTSPLFLKDEEPLNMAYLFSWLAIMFILGHEIGHIVCGHFSDSDTCFSIVEPDGYQELSFTQLREIEADNFGELICHASCAERGVDSIIGTFSVCITFFVFSYIYKAIATVLGKNDINWDSNVFVSSLSSHPSPSQRILNLKNKYVPRKVDGDRSIEYFEYLYNVFRMLWEVPMKMHERSSFVPQKIHSRWSAVEKSLLSYM